jgi:hypothetical protein
MHIYRFKVLFEDQDGFYREFELQSDQTFLDFHLAIVANLKLDPGMLSSFFTCNDHFRKKQEISLVDMDQEPTDGTGKPVLIMEECRLNDFIDDPHQKLLYVYDYLNYWTFYIELLRILPADKDKQYPHLHRAAGEVPRELTATPGAMPEGERSMDLFLGEDVYDPEDLEHLEGEEEDPYSDRSGNNEGFEEDSP